MSTDGDLTPTSYALLGLLAIKPWTTYELAQQMDRTLSRFWPRAKSKLYEEPKKLVARGLARATDDAVGKRSRTIYTITAKGRRALAAWVAEPGEGPVLEFEQLLKVFFGDNGTTDDMRRTLYHVRAWAHERTLVNVEVGRSYLEGRGAFPERAAVNMVVGRFLDDFLETVDRWAEWATGTIASWPDHPRDAEADARALAEIIERGSQRADRWRAALAVME
ncbi:MAG TPA: PadR family transcriptional regulator [Acidimicrobiales bacterium]|jgi:DNA-binding PadR family transcriptional regulator|nr:PadR family transcriptional regulator [Acidimicrobiales bacterium]